MIFRIPKLAQNFLNIRTLQLLYLYKIENINTILEDADKKYNVQKLNNQLELEQDSIKIKELLGQDVIIEIDKVIRNAIKNGNIRTHQDGSKYIIEDIVNLPINNIKFKELNKYIEKYHECITDTIMNNLESKKDINITHLFIEGQGEFSYLFSPTQNSILFCIALMFPPIWPLVIYETYRYIRTRRRGYLPLTLIVIFLKKKESNDIALGLPAI